MMKTPSGRISTLGLILSLVITSCVPSPKIPTDLAPELIPTMETVVTPHQSPTPTDKVNFQATSSPTQAIVLPTPTITPTTEPTLTADQREAYIKELLQTNKGCLLPCWWGIIPGETTGDELGAFLAYTGARYGTKAGVGNTTTYHASYVFTRDRNDLTNSLEIREKAGVVDFMEVSASSLPEDDYFHEYWQAYEPRQVFHRYGPPSRILVYLSQYGGDMADYSLWVIYDHLRFMLIYGGATKQQPVFHVCLEFDVDKAVMGIEIITKSPTNTGHLELLSEQHLLRSDLLRPIEEAAGISTEEFYQILISDDKEPCFDSPRVIWAPP